MGREGFFWLKRNKTSCQKVLEIISEVRRMNFLFPILFALLCLFPAGAYGSGDDLAAASVPEPSVALIGGLCGIIFLLWRKK